MIGAPSGGLTLDGGTLQVTGTAFISQARALTLGEHGGGFDIEDAGNTFTIVQTLSGQGRLWKQGDGTLLLSGDNSFAGGLTVEKGTAQAGVADHAFGSGLLTVNDGAKADLANFNTMTGGLAGAGHVAMGSGNLTLDQDFDTLFSGVIDGSGALTKAGTGTLTFSGTNTYTGRTMVSGGILKQGAQGAFSTSSSGYEVAADGTLDLGGFDTTLSNLGNTGNVNFGGNAGATLTVTGNYVGQGGTVVLNTVLGDDNSKTDRLHVNGDTSGATALKVNNVGGAGAETNNGIEVVAVDGASNGTFSLTNGSRTKDGKLAVIGGAYAYTLQQGGANTPNDGNWYLVNHINQPNNPDTPVPPRQPRYSSSIPVYQGYVENMQALNRLPTLQERVGNRYWTGENGDGQTNGAVIDNRGVWARIQGGNSRLEPQSVTGMKHEVNSFIMQAGVDGQFYEGATGKLVAGITGQYGRAYGNSSSFFGDGSINTNAWSLGATATWYGNGGFYVDGQSQVTWFDNDLYSKDLGTDLKDNAKATGYALSVEAGQRVAIDDHWALTPQAQLMWSSLDARTFQDIKNNPFDLEDGNSLVGRLGLAANYRNDWKGADGLMVNTSVYGIANLYQEFLGGTRINVAGVDFDTDNDRTWAGVGAGGTYAWADNKYAVYGEGSINTSLNHFANSYSLKATAGFKVKW
ncbi:autotransporter outer membrane beta-barrel domain-containing protein [Brucella anthropi]